MLISIILMVIFVLTTTSTFSFAEQNMAWQKEKIVEQNPANCWGSASLHIAGITSNESDQRTRTISSGIKYENIACWVKDEMYEWDGDKWVFESYFSSSASDSNTGSFPVKHMKPFCTLLKQHPCLTSIIKNL